MSRSQDTKKSGRNGANHYDFTQVFMVQQDMKKCFRRLAINAQRLDQGLKRAHDRFYKKCVKSKRQDMVQQIDEFINSGKDEEELKRVYLTPFAAANGLIKRRNPDGTLKARHEKHRDASEDTSIVKVTDYLSIIDPILEKRRILNEKYVSEEDRNEVLYLIKNKERILDDTEKGQYRRDYTYTQVEQEGRRIAKMLCDSSNDLRGVKVHDFKKYMSNDVILERCSHYMLPGLREKHQNRALTQNDIVELLKSPVDKYLFIMFRDHQLTIDQIKCRLAKTNQGVTYTVLDDLRDTLDPELIKRSTRQPGGPDPNIEAFKIYRKKEKNEDGTLTVALSEILNPNMEPWQTNPHCLRSLYNDGAKYQLRLQNERMLKIDEKRSRELQQQLTQTQHSKQQSHSPPPIKRQNAEVIIPENFDGPEVIPEMPAQQKKVKPQKMRLPSRSLDRKQDYDQFLTIMTEKLKSDLKNEVNKKTLRAKQEIIRESFNEVKELLKEAEAIYNQNVSSKKQPKKELFKSSGVSHTILEIRDQLTKEQAQIKSMLFLKQLDEDTVHGTGSSAGKHAIVWDDNTLELLKSVEEEKERLNNTDYKRALKPRKPRPGAVISGEVAALDLSKIKFEFASPFIYHLGHSTNVKEYLPGEKVITPFDSQSAQELLQPPSQVALIKVSIRQSLKANVSAIRIEDSRIYDNVVTDYMNDDVIIGGQRCDSALSKSPLKSKRQSTNDDQNRNQIEISEMKGSQSNDQLKSSSKTTRNAIQQKSAKKIIAQMNSYDSKHGINSGGGQFTTTSSISGDEYPNIGGGGSLRPNRTLIFNNPPLYYKPLERSVLATTNRQRIVIKHQQLESESSGLQDGSLPQDNPLTHMEGILSTFGGESDTMRVLEVKNQTLLPFTSRNLPGFTNSRTMVQYRFPCRQMSAAGPVKGQRKKSSTKQTCKCKIKSCIL